VEKYQGLKTGETLKDVEIQVGARIVTKRSYGNSLRFYHVKAEEVSMQIMCERSYWYAIRGAA
jgi:lysyl-tRNA synthetase, class II